MQESSEQTPIKETPETVTVSIAPVNIGAYSDGYRDGTMDALWCVIAILSILAALSIVYHESNV